MRLSRVRIRNFRSIAAVTILLEPSCRILVGVNESGKTNILKAMALLQPQALPDVMDIREPRPGDTVEPDAYVGFVLVFDPSERAAIYKAAAAQVLSRQADRPMLAHGNRAFAFAEVCESRKEGLYIVNLRTQQKHPSIWALDRGFTLLPSWKKPSAACPPDFSIHQEDGSDRLLSNLDLVNTDDYPDIPADYLEAASAAEFDELVSQPGRSLILQNLPRCIFWSYSEANLLPGQIPMQAFAANPDTCLPLKRMFSLVGIDDIQTAINGARSRPNSLRNLLNRVADRSTQHMHQIWDYNGLRINLSPNGEMIDAAIQDTHNLYDMSHRSDGFKRFLSFLLSVSVETRTSKLQNTLYLHDEPDTSLHPSGARHLRDELIRISKDNYVVYSTHSVFMIDRDFIGRQLIVEKKEEVTTVREATDSNIMDEEVIYNALYFNLRGPGTNQPRPGGGGT